MSPVHRLYAYTVLPQKNTDSASLIAPVGGSVKLTNEVEQLLQKAFIKASSGTFTTVDFELDDKRSNLVRDNMMTAAFGPTNAPKAAASRLALRLSEKMDGRSQVYLFVIAIEENGPKTTISLLVFPREDVIQMRGTSDENILNLVRDAFSTGSGLRKLARAEGHNSKTQFLSLEILDFQINKSNKIVADFWTNYLGAKTRIDSQTGSRQLAISLQQSFDAATEELRDSVLAAMLKARSQSNLRTTLEKFANEIPEELHAVFFRGVKSEDMKKSTFLLSREVIADHLARLIITTKDGVVISAPSKEVGKTVEIERKKGESVVSYSGRITKERVSRLDRRSKQT